jgi:hypothetical protein
MMDSLIAVKDVVIGVALFAFPVSVAVCLYGLLISLLVKQWSEVQFYLLSLIYLAAIFWVTYVVVRLNDYSHDDQYYEGEVPGRTEELIGITMLASLVEILVACFAFCVYILLREFQAMRAEGKS